MISANNEAVTRCRIGKWKPKRYSRHRRAKPFSKTTAALIAFVERRAK